MLSFGSLQEGRYFLGASWTGLKTVPRWRMRGPSKPGSDERFVD